MPPRLYYIRHGETDWNVAGRLQGRRDIPINARGREQAVRCGTILHDLLARDSIEPAQLDFVGSPLGRARETMELVRHALGLPREGYRTDARLAEVDFGQWEGCTMDELRRQFPDALAARDLDLWGYTPPEAESYATMSQRVRECYGQLTRDTVMVAHGGTLRGLLVQLGIASIAEAPSVDITQGVVFAIQPGSLSRYG